MKFFSFKITHGRMKKISSESEAVPPVSQNFVFSGQNFDLQEKYTLNFFCVKLHTDV
jgi:hypothetical protein